MITERWNPVSSKSLKTQIDMLAKMVEEANVAKADDTTFGRCDWTDLEGNKRCNSPWSEFQCQQAGGTFTPGGKCDD